MAIWKAKNEKGKKEGKGGGREGSREGRKEGEKTRNKYDSVDTRLFFFFFALFLISATAYDSCWHWVI